MQNTTKSYRQRRFASYACDGLRLSADAGAGVRHDARLAANAPATLELASRPTPDTGRSADARCILRRVKWAAVAALLTAVATVLPAAFAQYPGGHGGGQGTQRPGSAHDRAVEATTSVGAPVLVQLDQLESDLKLTPQQRAAWDAYADQVLHLADAMTRSQFAARTAPPPTQSAAAQQLDQLVDSERKRLTAVEEIAAAGKTLYSLLDSEQRVIADRRLVLPIRPLATGVALPAIGDAGDRSER